jgi:S1-C subfamily serine protease
VVAGSPAASAGIRTGARLIEAGGKPLAATLDFENVLLDLRAGDEIVLKVEGITQPVRLEAEALPTTRAERVRAADGLEVITVTPSVRGEQGLGSDAGALIVNASEAIQSQIGLARGDVLLRVTTAAGTTEVKNAEDARRAFARLRRGERVLIVIERGGSLIQTQFAWPG